jgi:hypothetical protein
LTNFYFINVETSGSNARDKLTYVNPILILCYIKLNTVSDGLMLAAVLIFFHISVSVRDVTILDCVFIVTRRSVCGL